MSEEFEAEFTAEDGNVRSQIWWDDVRMTFVAGPSKMRELAAAILRACNDADEQMPGGFDHGDLVT
jgi:hypothetical protein